MTNSGTAGKQYVMPNTPHVISLLGRVDKNILGTSPLRVRRKTGWWRRRLSLQSLLVRVEGDPLSTQYAQRRSFQATEEEEEEEEEEVRRRSAGAGTGSGSGSGSGPGPGSGPG